MPSRARRPFAVAISDWMVGAAAVMAPRAQRPDWKREWHAEIWHRWQFLWHTGAWDRREKLCLIRGTLGAFQDAACLLKAHEAFWQRLREWARSPFTCLGALGALLLVTAVLSGGLPASRELLSGQGNLQFIWMHPSSGGRDKGLPPDLVPAWASHSHSLEKIAAFQIGRPAGEQQPLLVTVQPQFFDVVGVKPAVGSIPRERAIVLDYRAWASLTHANPKALGVPLKIGTASYPVAAVLPRNFWILSRQPTVYLVEREIKNGLVFAVARAKAGVTREQLDKELVKIAQDVSYYFLDSELRYGAWTSVLLTPLRLFGVAVLLAGGAAGLSVPVTRLPGCRGAPFAIFRRQSHPGAGLGLRGVSGGDPVGIGDPAGFTRPGRRAVSGVALRPGHDGCLVLGGRRSARTLSRVP